MEIGPIQLVTVAFTDPKLDGSILTALEDATAAGHIKVIDALGVFKDTDGSFVAAEISGVSEEEAMMYGAWIGALIGLGAGGVEGAEAGAIAGAIAAADEYEYGIGDEELAAISDAIPEGGGALLLAVEHTWAIPLRNAAAASGGIVIANDFLNPMALVALGVLASEEM